MNADISRRSFNPLKRYSRVVFQQGRPLTDSDLTEQGEIMLDYTHRLARAIFGSSCAIDAPAFEIAPKGRLNVALADNGIDFSIGLGRFYAEGFLCNNTKIDSFGRQFLPEPAPKLFAAGWWLVYLEVWEQVFTAVQDPELLDDAFEGLDTSARAKIMFRVRVLTPSAGMGGLQLAPNANTEDTFKNLQKFLSEQQPRQGQASFEFSPAGRLENSLYRIEIHRILGGAKAAQVKVSRTNASMSFPVQKVQRADQGRIHFQVDSKSLRNAGFPAVETDVELVSEVDMERRNPGKLGKLIQVTETGACILQGVGDEPVDGTGAFLRLWDDVREIKFDSEEFVELIDGLKIKLLTTNHRGGDFWMISRRNQSALENISPNGPRLARVPIGAINVEGTGQDQKILAVKSVRAVYNPSALLKWP